MRHTNSSATLQRQELGVSRYVPVTHFNSPTVLETTSGAMFSVIKLQGVAFDTEKADVLNSYKRLWHRAVMMLDERFSLVGTIHRHKETTELTGEFTNAFAKRVDEAYHQTFKNKAMYLNDLYLAVVFKGVTTGKTGKLTQLTKKISGRYVKQARQSLREQQLKQLDGAVTQLVSSLSEFGPSVLGARDEAVGHSELLTYLSLFVNGGEPLKFRGQAVYAPMGGTLEKTLAAQARYPNGCVAQYITAKRLFFGDYIQFQGATKENVRYGAMVSLKRYADQTASVMLDPLLQLDCEFISTQSFTPEPKADSDKRIVRQINKLDNADDPAVSQLDALMDARDMLASDHIAMGYHHNSLLLLQDTRQALDKQVRQAIKCYMQVGFVAVKETLGQEAAFWAQLPANFQHVARASLITSENFVDFFPLHNYRTGFKDGNHLGSALTLIETQSRTPLFLNLHAKGPRDNPAPGHTTLVGGNGSGKTVAMCFFDAQLNRYGGRSFFFDRNRGAEIYIRASGGYYAVLSPDYPNDIRFNPFQLADTPVNRTFCKTWLTQLVKRDEETEVEEHIVAQLNQCVDYAFENLEPRARSLRHAVAILPVTFERWTRLHRWLRGDGTRSDGDYAYLFDHEEDGLAMHDKMGFDMTHFLDNEPPAVLTAVTMYLFHRLELSLQESGQLVSVFLDEAWQYLDNPYWQAKLRQWLPTLRKLNCHLVFATQSPKSVVASPISHTILDNCATQLYFANPQAKPEHYIEGFNLTEAEYDCIKNNEPQSRLFLYKQGHASALGRLNLAHLNDLLKIMSGTQANVTRLSQLRAEFGDNPDDWIPYFLKESE